MKKSNVSDLIRGWFVGDFERAIYRTKDCETAFQEYNEGDYEKKHIHKIATEITFVAKGRILMNGKEYQKGDIILIEPGESTDFKALTDAATIVVKIPSIIGDKYMVE